MYSESQNPGPEAKPEKKIPDETRSEREIVREKFKALTGAESSETTEAQELVGRMSQIAAEFIDTFISNNLITEQEAEEIKQKWENAIILDRDGMYKAMDFMAGPYKAATTELGSRKEKTPENTELTNRLERVVQGLYNQIDSGPATLCRPQPEHISFGRPDLPKVLRENPGEYLLINARYFEKSETVDRDMQIVAMEETCHMLSHLKDYGLHIKWLEETMARVIAVNIPGGHIEKPEGLEEVKKFLRYKDYEELFSGIVNQAGVQEETVIKMFLGTEPLDSPNIGKVREAVERLNLLGEIVDQGISLQGLREAREKPTVKGNA